MNRCNPRARRRSTMHRRRAFTLVELIFVIGLLGVFALVSTRLLVACLKIPHEAGLKRDAVVRFESVISAMRRDIWTAQTLSSPDEHTLILESADGGKTTWSVQSDEVKRSTGATEKPHAWPLSQQLKFAVAGPTMTLTVVEDAAHRDQIEMISQAMIARGEAFK